MPYPIPIHGLIAGVSSHIHIHAENPKHNAIVYATKQAMQEIQVYIHPSASVETDIAAPWRPIRIQQTIIDLNNDQLLNIPTRTLRIHTVPGSICKSAADGPHDGYGGFGGT